jgi:hypothetical protein
VLTLSPYADEWPEYAKEDSPIQYSDILKDNLKEYQLEMSTTNLNRLELADMWVPR